ncbi:hypothetical protein ACFLXJ_06075 [Chloroflexota bacterium]
MKIKAILKITIIIVIAVLFWSTFSISYLYIHEYGHYSAGLITDIPTEKMTVHYETLFDIIPYPTRIDHPGVVTSKFFKFFGGFLAGTTMLIFSIIAFILHRKKNDTLLTYWSIFAITLGLTIFGYIECIIEPFFPELHMHLIETLIGALAVFVLPMVLIRKQLYSHLP